MLGPLLLAFALLTLTASAARASAGQPDAGFGRRGVVTTFPNGSVATGVSIDGRGRITVVGYSIEAHPVVLVVRFRADGSLDPTFGRDGRARFDLKGSDEAFDVAAAPDGGVAITGRRTAAAETTFVLRLRADGTRRSSFATNGVAWVDFGTPRQSADAIAFTQQGRIVIGGSSSSGVRSRSVLARLLPGGAQDPSFAGDGTAAFDLAPGTEQIRDLIVLPGGSVIADGYTEGGAQYPRFGLVRVTAGGQRDRSFGTDAPGFSSIDVAAGPDIANALMRAANGNYLLAGYSRGDWAVVATDAAGTVDTGYGTNGRVILQLAPAFEEATDIVASGNGAFVVGRIRGKGDDLGVVRLRSRGGLDRSFGNDGIVRIDVYGFTDAGSAAALQTNGKLVVAGQTWRAGVPRFLVARLLGL